MQLCMINKPWRKSKGQSRMDNPETLITMQDTSRRQIKKTKHKQHNTETKKDEHSTGQCSWTTTLGHIEPELHNDFLQQEAVQTIPWSAMSPDMNLVEHAWNFIGRKINQRNPKCQNIDELRNAILQEWQQFPQERRRPLVRSMTRRVTELHNKRGGYTRY